jgi:hypothetical protein
MAKIILTRQQIDHLLLVYSTIGKLEAEELASHYGMKPSYVRLVAQRHGVQVKRDDDNTQRKRASYSRWERARAIGVVET